MMMMLSLPASMQQELAARALRACMAAEAAMASLRAECKPLESASPQRVLALNTKNMANAHRSLQLQIEACESFSLSATAAFKQLCDAIFCTDSEKSMNFEHSTHCSKSSKAQLIDLTSVIDEELLDCGSWKSRTDAPDQSSARSDEGTPANDTTKRDQPAEVQVTEAQDILLWGPENGAAYTRFLSPDTDNEATTREEIVEQILIKDSDWSPQLDSQYMNYHEDLPQFGNDVVMPKIQEDSDVCDLDLDLRCDISSLRENSTLSTISSENQLDDDYTLRKTIKSQSISANAESLTCAVEQGGSSAQIHQATTSDIAEVNSKHGHHATESMAIHSNESTRPSRLTGDAKIYFQQTMDVESPPCVSDAPSGVSSHTLMGSPPPASSSSNEIPERHNFYDPIELQPATPSFSTPIHASWTMAEVTCTQTPCSSASRFSWSCETTRSMDTPSTTQSLSILEYNPRMMYASVGKRWNPSKLSSDLPLYPAHPQSTKPITGTNSIPASSAMRGLHQVSKASFESQDRAVRKLQPLFDREIDHCPPSPTYADENQYMEPNVPLTPSPYAPKMKSMFSQANLAQKPIYVHPMYAPMQSSYGHSDGNLFSMATSVSLSSGYHQPSMSSRLPCGSSAYVSVTEKQALQIVSETPLLSQYSVSPISSSISTSNLSWESPVSSNNSASDSSGREGSLDNYKRKLENLQEQFPRAHGSFRGESHSAWESRRIGTLVSKPVGNSSLQNVCKIPWQTSHISTTTTEVERYVGAASSTGSAFEAKHISAQRRPTDGGVGYIQGNLSDHSVCYRSKGSLESDSRYDGIMQGYKISESHVSEVGNREFRDVTSRDPNKKDFAQISQSRPELATSCWRWKDDQSSKETGAPVPISPSCRTSDSVAMASGAGDSCARVESTRLRLTQLSDSEDDDDDDSSTEREWNNILIRMQQRGKPKAF